MSSFVSMFPMSMHLALYIIPTGDSDIDMDLRNRYENHIVSHNNSMNTCSHPDAGFDLISPIIDKFEVGKTKKHKLGIKCSAKMVYTNSDYGPTPTGYMMYPRSSISKTSLRLANSAGVIDSGYRGELMAAFDCFFKDYSIDYGMRIMQIVAPGMVPIKVYLVDDESSLGSPTVRGSGGFGSTGS